MAENKMKEITFAQAINEAISEEMRRDETVFMLGEDILAAPVVTKGTRERTVYFPEGCWEDEEGKRYQGRTAQTLPAPLEKLLWYKRVKI